MTQPEQTQITSHDFLTAVKNRRTIYALSKESPIPDARIEEIIGDAVLHTPSAFNSQSARVVLLLGAQHDKLWDMTKEALRKIVPAESFDSTESRINGFRNAYGSVLFFEDQTVIELLQEKFASYKDNFPIWSQQSNGMLQYVIWTALELEGLGVSLQHYNPLIDADVRSEWNIPDNWKLIAQMPFGTKAGEAGDKEFKRLEERFKVEK
jgi:uncharacterized protein